MGLSLVPVGGGAYRAELLQAQAIGARLLRVAPSGQTASMDLTLAGTSDTPERWQAEAAFCARGPGVATR